MARNFLTFSPCVSAAFQDMELLGTFMTLDDVKQLKGQVLEAYRVDLEKGACLRIAAEDMPAFESFIDSKVKQTALSAAERELDLVRIAPEENGLNWLEKHKQSLIGLFSYGDKESVPGNRERVRQVLQAAACHTAEVGMRLFEASKEYRSLEDVKRGYDYLQSLYSFDDRKMTEDEKLGLDKAAWKKSMQIRLNSEPASLEKLFRATAFLGLMRGDERAKTSAFYRSGLYKVGLRPVFVAVLGEGARFYPNPSLGRT